MDKVSHVHRRRPLLGGAFALLVSDCEDAPELGVVRRFRHEWERDASLRLRAGRRTAIDQYAKHGRITGGPRDVILDELYTAWRADIEAGRTLAGAMVARLHADPQFQADMKKARAEIARAKTAPRNCAT